MTSALGLSSVTATLESLLFDVFNGPDWTNLGLSPVAVTAIAPDLVQSAARDGALQLNLFLHQVTYNPAWRNMDLPSRAVDGRTRLTNPPLALDLHYLMTAYAADDCHAEAILGFAVQFLHENPILARDQIRAALASLGKLTNPSTPAFQAIQLAGLAEQLEMVKITPVAMGREEMAWVWTALKADYRLTFPFQVSVVLIQTPKPAVSALPVLTRQIAATPNLFPGPTLLQATSPHNQPAAQLGDLVTAQGAELAKVNGVALSNARLGVSLLITSSLANVGDMSFQFSLAAPEVTAASLPAGVYLLAARTGPDHVFTNALPFAVAPKIATSPPTATAGAPVAVTFAPNAVVGQDVALLIGGQEAPPTTSITAPTNALSFVFPSFVELNTLPLRLRVDGVDSPIVDMTKTPPIFSGPSIQVV